MIAVKQKSGMVSISRVAEKCTRRYSLYIKKLLTRRANSPLSSEAPSEKICGATFYKRKKKIRFIKNVLEYTYANHIHLGTRHLSISFLFKFQMLITSPDKNIVAIGRWKATRNNPKFNAGPLFGPGANCPKKARFPPVGRPRFLPAQSVLTAIPFRGPCPPRPPTPTCCPSPAHYPPPSNPSPYLATPNGLVLSHPSASSSLARPSQHSPYTPNPCSREPPSHLPS
jgi:hypothetical protein